MELIIQGDRMQVVEGITAEYPYVLNRADGNETAVPWHWHEEVEFSYVVRGKLRVTVAGRNYVFQPGEGFYINTNILHTMEPADPQEGVYWYSYMFHPMFLSGHYKSVFETKYMSPILKNKRCDLIPFFGQDVRQQQILQLLLQAEQLEEQPGGEFRIRNIFSEIWLLLMGVIEASAESFRLTNPVNQERIQSMLTYIHRHYHEKITLEQIAAAAVVSKRECLRCFQSCIQKTPFEYLLDYRVQIAEKLLQTTTLSITEIALQTGFSNSAYFTKVFKALRKISPSQYRKKNGLT